MRSLTNQRGKRNKTNLLSKHDTTVNLGRLYENEPSSSKIISEFFQVVNYVDGTFDCVNIDKIIHKCDLNLM